MTDLERLQSTEIVPTPEMATLDCGTVNFGGDEVFTNTNTTIENFAKILKERGIKPELEVFDKATSIPAGSTWTATGLGKNAWHIAAATISLGGHVRVGFEDNLYLEKGVLAKSNGEMVEKAVKLAKLLGREIATPDEAREILGLPKRTW